MTAREFSRCFGSCDTATLATRVTLHQDGQLLFRAVHRRREPVDHIRVVRHHAQFDLAGQFPQALLFGLAHKIVGDHHVVDAGNSTSHPPPKVSGR